MNQPSNRSSTAAPSDSLKLRVLEAARSQSSPPRSDRMLAGLALVALSVLVMVGLLEFEGGLAHADGRPEIVGLWVVAGVLALAVAATWFSLPSRRSMLAPSRGQLLAVAIGVPILLGVWLLLWHTTYADPFVRVGTRCLSLTLLSAPLPFFALAHASRRFEPRHPHLAGAALGATAGAWAAVMVELWCPLADPQHVAIGHVAPLVVVILAATAYGWFRFGLRRVK